VPASDFTEVLLSPKSPCGASSAGHLSGGMIQVLGGEYYASYNHGRAGDNLSGFKVW
jgi:hypothetical protein